MTWQRIESSSVDPEIEEGLQAAIADPMWAMARQWQAGEFRGEDAANPLLVRLRARSVEIDTWQAGPPDGAGQVRPVGPGTALEPIVEAESPSDGTSAARTGAEAAHLLAERLRTVSTLDARTRGEVLDRLRQAFPLRPPSDVRRRDRAGDHRLTVLARTSFDGVAFGQAVAQRPAEVTRELFGDLGLDAELQRIIGEAIVDWGSLLASVFVGAASPSAWNPTRMEYEFQVGAPAGDSEFGVTFAAKDYGGGRLDWYSFDAVGVHKRGTAGKVENHESELLPVPLRYPGMPASRFWEFEDAEVYFGDISAEPDDVARVALGAYATVYGDDWFLVPLTVPAGRVVQVTSVEMLDDFGGVTEIPSSAAIDGPDRIFRFFEMTGDRSTDGGDAPILFIPPVVDATDAGRPLDDIAIGRDERSNLAWAVERRVEGTYGRGIDPLAARAGDGPRIESPPAGHDPDAPWTFDLGGDVPENWVPMVPVRIDKSAEIGLQRGRVPIAGGAESRGALSRLLEPDRRLIVEESEVPSAGLRVMRRFQSARTRTGALRVWLGRQKGPGRPTADSGYSTDQLRR